MKFFKKRKNIFRGDKLLLVRWNLFECSLFSIKIHKLVTSDDLCLHDHPWAFYTFLFKGGYVEYHHRKVGDGIMEVRSKVYSRFSLLYRPANYAHRLEIHQPVWTLVLTLKKERVWGFFTGKGWVEWFKFDDVNERC